MSLACCQSRRHIKSNCMSYILDALKKAEAEREREAVPGIHAQPARGWSAQAAQPAPARLLTLWFALGLAVVVAGLIAWRISGSQSSHPVAVEIAPTATPMLLPGVLAAPVPTERAAVAARVVEAQVAPPRPIPSRIEPVVMTRKPSSTAVAAVVVPKQVEARTTAAATAAAASAVVDEKVVTLAEIPDEIRRELPSLTISGAIYSENVANRFLIINGQIFHETETPVPGVVLHKIKLKSAVLGFKGYRYSVTY